jgi:hypothetical protein
MSCEEPLVNNPDESNRSIFTCVVEADRVEQAQNKLRNLLYKLRKEHEMFGQATEIYLDDLIEIKRVPPDGFLSRYEISTRGGDFDNVSTALPGIAEEDCSLYTILPAEGHDQDKPVRLQSFVTF